MHKLGNLIFFIYLTIEPLTLLSSENNTKFYIKKPKQINLTTYEVQWVLNETLAKSVLGFIVCTLDKNSTQKMCLPFSPSSRSAALPHLLDSHSGISILATFNDSEPLSSSISLHKFSRLIYQDSILEGCNDPDLEECEDLPKWKGNILAACFGKSGNEIFVATNERLTWHNVVMNQTKEYRYNFGDQIHRIDYDPLNRLILIVDKNKIYQINKSSEVITEVKSKDPLEFLDAIADPINGLIHILLRRNTEYSYTSIPSVISKNTTLQESTLVVKAISTSYSLLLDENLLSLKILGNDSIYTFFLENSTFRLYISLKGIKYNDSAKLMKEDNNYWVFSATEAYQLHGNVSTPIKHDYRLFSVIKQPSQQLSTPVLPFEIENSFFGPNFVTIIWKLPVGKWQSERRWTKYVYEVQITSNGTKLLINTGSKTSFEYRDLKEDSYIQVSIKVGQFSVSIVGKTLNRRVERMLKYYVVQNGTMTKFETDLNHLKESPTVINLNMDRSVFSFEVYKNCNYTLFLNGTLVVRHINSTAFMLPQYAANKFEVDHETGNIFFIDSKTRWIHRYRLIWEGTYRTDVLIQESADDFALFLNSGVLAYLRKGEIMFSDLNGFLKSESKNISKEILSFQCRKNESLFIVVIGGLRKLLSSSTKRNQCFATRYGMVRPAKGEMILQNWEGNSSLRLSRDSVNITDISFFRNIVVKRLLVPSVTVESIRLVRSKTDAIILSWKSGTNSSGFGSAVTIFNQRLNTIWKFFLKDFFFSIKQYGICSDQIEISIRLYTDSTFGDPIKKNLTVPCVTETLNIWSLFANKKIRPGIKRTSIEIWVNYSTSANERIVDNKYFCRLITFFKKTSLKQHLVHIIQNQTVSCLNNIFVSNIEVERNSQFEWPYFCVKVEIQDLSEEKCIENSILKTDEQKIILPPEQTLVLTFVGEKIVSLKVGSNGRSIVLAGSNKETRSILSTEDLITKIEIDWLKNNLFWSEKNNSWTNLFIVDLKRNKRNLYEDKVLWFQMNGTQIQWTTNVIERKLIISSKEKTHIFSLNMDPGWSNDHETLVKCEDLIKRNNRSKTCDFIRHNNSQKLRSHLLMDGRSLIYENLDESICKIVTIRSNYNLPRDVVNCSSFWTRDAYNMTVERTVLNEDKVIDEWGFVSEKRVNAQNISFLSLENGTLYFGLECHRKSALLFFNATKIYSAYKFYVSYKNIQLKDFTKSNLLSNFLNDNSSFEILISGLNPGRTYQIIVEVVSPSTNDSRNISLQCLTPRDVPEPPTNITILKLNGTHSQISWAPGIDNGESIFEYKIYIKLPDSRVINFSTNETTIKIPLKNHNLLAFVESVNNLGSSLPASILMNPTETRKQINISGNHFTMAYSTSVFLIIILCLAIFALIISVYTHYLSKRRRINSQRSENNVNRQNVEMIKFAQNIQFEKNCLYGFDKLPLSNFDKIPHILNECIMYSHLIGNGAFGMVFKGTMKIGSDNDEEKCVPVALKIRNEKSISEEDFKREAILLFKYSHPNIIELYGVSFDCPDKQCLILEYMEKGNLRQYLQHHRPDVIRQRMRNNPKQKFINENSILDSKSLINIASDVLEALKYLEEKRFVHRDIAARNCLVSHKRNNKRITKLGDFGLARDIYSNDYYRKSSETKLPVRWMAPETMKDGVFTGKSDVWAFGILCWEIMTFGADPYMGQSNSEVIKDVIAGKHMERPEDCPNEFFEIMLQCWKYYPECRPSFSEIDLIFQYLDEIKDTEDVSTLSRLIIRSYNSCQDSEFGRNSDPVTEKTSITLSDKDVDDTFLSSKQEFVPVQMNYDNLGYEVPLFPVMK